MDGVGLKRMETRQARDEYLQRLQTPGGVAFGAAA
jgi:hypothetical protein